MLLQYSNLDNILLVLMHCSVDAPVLLQATSHLEKQLANFLNFKKVQSKEKAND